MNCVISCYGNKNYITHLSFLSTKSSKVYDYFKMWVVDEKRVAIVYDFCSGGSVYSYLQTYSYLSEEQAKFIAIQLIEAVHYLHEKNCLFCGLQSENILIDDDGYIRLTSFSNSKLNCTSQQYEIIGYLEHVSPQMLLNKGVDQSYDWYQLGCLLYGFCLSVWLFLELIEGTLPFSGSTTTEILQRILLGKVNYQKASTEAQHLINSLLHADTQTRLGRINDFQNHQVFYVVQNWLLVV